MVQGKARYYEDVEPGDDIGPLEKAITHEAVIEFCGVWGHPSPNRFIDVKMAQEAKLPGPIVPGVMSIAMIAQLLTDWSPNGSLRLLDVVFRQPVVQGEVVIAAVVTDKREEDGENLVECDVYMSNEESGRLIGGRAVLSLPSRQERTPFAGDQNT